MYSPVFIHVRLIEIPAYMYKINAQMRLLHETDIVNNSTLRDLSKNQRSTVLAGNTRTSCIRNVEISRCYTSHHADRLHQFRSEFIITILIYTRISTS